MEKKTQNQHEETESHSRRESIWYRLFHKPRVLERETSFYILVSALDFFMTYLLLSRQDIRFVESNAIARFFLHHWGIRGMIYFKFALVAFVCLITQYIAQTHLKVARNILILAIVVVGGVVVYSLKLYLHGNVIVSEFPDIQLGLY